ncbi:MAG: hypothetical protein ACRC1K_21885, partial [Planctomycetia bacterium]
AAPVSRAAARTQLQQKASQHPLIKRAELLLGAKMLDVEQLTAPPPAPAPTVAVEPADEPDADVLHDAPPDEGDDP